jgi:apolipoprotein N-acyltransferase
LYTEATSYTGFTYTSERTPYTRYGNWFVVVCAALVAMALLAEVTGIMATDKHG